MNARRCTIYNLSRSSGCHMTDGRRKLTHKRPGPMDRGEKRAATELKTNELLDSIHRLFSAAPCVLWLLLSPWAVATVLCGVINSGKSVAADRRILAAWKTVLRVLVPRRTAVEELGDPINRPLPQFRISRVQLLIWYVTFLCERRLRKCRSGKSRSVAVAGFFVGDISDVH